jgi:alpha-beta hydrolase superfamily lysophospholipase
MTPAPLPVLFVHGIQSHPDWFTGSADMLAARGHPVYQVMRRGSGTNTVARGDARSPGQLMDDLDAACAFVLRHAAEQGLAVCNPGALHVVGISWGGKLVAAWAASRRRAYAASLTLVAPGIISRVDLPPAIKLRIAWALLAHPRRLFDIPLNDLSLFTDNPARRDYLSRDPHRLHRATARFLFASRRLEAMLIRAKAGSLNIPTTLILARQDRIIDNGRTRRIVEHLTAGRAMVHVLDGCHTLEFEADPTAFHECLRIGIRE